MKRILPTIAGLVACVVAATALSDVSALAQATVVAPATGVPVGNVINAVLVPLVEAAASGVATFFIGWAAIWVKAKFHVDIEAQHRDALHSAIMSGINLGLSKAGASLSTLSFSTKNTVIDTALAYVLQSVPDALNYLGVDASNPQKLTELVESKLSALVNTTASVATVQASPAAGGGGA